MAEAEAEERNDEIEIREVWQENLHREFALIREIVDEFPYVSMDTEFPGVVVRPVGAFLSNSDYNYVTLKANVDLLKLIQLGLTFCDAYGNLPTCGTDNKRCVWQFNFREFNQKIDVYASDSITLLKNSGIDLEKNVASGIDALVFTELMMSSGVILNEDIHWVTFHSGYDFGYLLKMFTLKKLPETQKEFHELMRIYFPVFYDIKYLCIFLDNLYGGLNRIAEVLNVKRVGISHQAGSDSLLTSFVFQKLKVIYFHGETLKYSGVLYGLGTGAN